MKNKSKTMMVGVAFALVSLISAPSIIAADERDQRLQKEKFDKWEAEQQKNSRLAAIEKPPSLCLGEAMQKTQNFFNTLIPDVCDMIDAEPDVQGSRYRYENPDGGCDIGLRMPGLPDFGFSAEGFDMCALVSTVLSDQIDAVNRGMREGVNGALDTIKEKTGLKDFNLDINANDIVTGDEDFRD